jgi:hypothetical protein
MTLQEDLQGYYGSEHFYRMPMTNVIYTEGVQHFAEFGRAYWALTDMITTYKFKFPREEFLAITITSTGKKADIVYTDGNCNILKKQHYAHTDLEKGEYKFYLTNDTLLLTSEY